MAQENGIHSAESDAASNQRQDVLSVFDQPQVTRDQILALQDSMVGLEQIECAVNHYFAPGLYAREITMPAGACVVGKIHKHSHVNTISKGRCRVVTEFGSEVYEAPVSFVSLAGTKRAVYVEEEAVWTTYHPTVVCEVETDLEKIEKAVIADSYESLLEMMQ